jgi:membrane carboxypeptidase/penicillin-binding protein
MFEKRLQKRDLSLKRNLISLVETLDEIVGQIEYERDMPFYSSSLDPNNPSLSNAELATLLLEDRRFFVHQGFEFRAVPRLIRRFIRTGALGGISTIEQQVVRLATGRYERTFSRKMKEIILAHLLQYHCNKKHVLFFYMGRSYFGQGDLPPSFRTIQKEGLFS